MKVLFISPHFPAQMQQFTRGLAEVGARVYGVSDAPREQLPAAGEVDRPTVVGVHERGLPQLRPLVHVGHAGSGKSLGRVEPV